jgi:hypothetical protein
MSPVAEAFLRAVLAKDWQNAFLNLNGLNMWEMLRAQAALDRDDLNELWANRGVFERAIAWGGQAMPRMEYARDVVINRRLPTTAPGDLQQTGQVGDAQNFLAHLNFVRFDVDRLTFENDLTGRLPRPNPAAGRLTAADFEAAAQRLGVDVSAILAVAEVEAGRAGFDGGRPTIRYELHIFHGRTGGTYQPTHPHLSQPWVRGLALAQQPGTPYHNGGQPNEWSLMHGAMILRNHAEDAWSSASWGMFQVMGFNFRAAGWSSLADFVRDMFSSEAMHLRAFLGFVNSQRLVTHLQTHNWFAFAIYNGSDQARYGPLIEAAYNRHRANRVRQGLTP